MDDYLIINRLSSYICYGFPATSGKTSGCAFNFFLSYLGELKKDRPQIKKKKNQWPFIYEMFRWQRRDKWSFSINLETRTECFVRWLKVIPHPGWSTRRTLEKGWRGAAEFKTGRQRMDKPFRKKNPSIFHCQPGSKSKSLPSVSTLAGDQAATHCSAEQKSRQSRSAVRCTK